MSVGMVSKFTFFRKTLITVVFLVMLLVYMTTYSITHLLNISKDESGQKTTNSFYISDGRGLFSEIITKKERSLFRRLVTAFSQVVPSNVTYFMYGGTLLGSFRHHDMIPWDDDVDLLVRNEDKITLLNSLRALHPEYKVSVASKVIWKFYHISSTPTRTKWGAWPFIDIFFYGENETFLWDVHPRYSHTLYDKSDVFPLTTRPFMGHKIPAPKNTGAFLKTLYHNISDCWSSSWSHKHQAMVNRSRVVKIPCDALGKTFPFV